MQKLMKEWNHCGIEDAIAVTSREFDCFYREFINAVKREFPNDEIVNARKGHYDLFGFIKRGEQYVYFSFSVPRGKYPMDLNRSDCRFGILIRRARDANDFRGEMNHFCSCKTFKESVEQLLR